MAERSLLGEDALEPLVALLSLQCQSGDDMAASGLVGSPPHRLRAADVRGREILFSPPLNSVPPSPCAPSPRVPACQCRRGSLTFSGGAKRGLCAVWIVLPFARYSCSWESSSHAPPATNTNNMFHLCFDLNPCQKSRDCQLCKFARVHRQKWIQISPSMQRSLLESSQSRPSSAWRLRLASVP